MLTIAFEMGVVPIPVLPICIHLSWMRICKGERDGPPSTMTSGWRPVGNPTAAMTGEKANVAVVQFPKDCLLPSITIEMGWPKVRALDNNKMPVVKQAGGEPLRRMFKVTPSTCYCLILVRFKLKFMDLAVENQPPKPIGLG